jgi:hypothetical protein
MKFTLVAAIRYLDDYQLKPGEAITIDNWANEGHDLLIQARDLMEGSIRWGKTDEELEFLDEASNPHFRSLLKAVAKQNLCLQFIVTFPYIDGDDNLQLLITTREVALEALTRVDLAVPTSLASPSKTRQDAPKVRRGHLHASGGRKASLQSDAGAKPRNGKRA